MSGYLDWSFSDIWHMDDETSDLLVDPNSLLGRILFYGKYSTSPVVGVTAALVSGFFLKSSHETTLAIGLGVAAAYLPLAHFMTIREFDKDRDLKDEEYIKFITVELAERRLRDQEYLEGMQAQTANLINLITTAQVAEAMPRLALRQRHKALPRNLNTGNNLREA
jgi:hypothetical protein